MVMHEEMLLVLKQAAPQTVGVMWTGLYYSVALKGTSQLLGMAFCCIIFLFTVD